MSAAGVDAFAAFLARWRRPFFVTLYAVSALEVICALTILVWSLARPADVPRWGGAVLFLLLGALGCRLSRRMLHDAPAPVAR